MIYIIKKISNFLLWFIAVAFSLYLISLVFFYFKQERFFFNPKYLSEDYVYQFKEAYEELEIKVEDEISLNAVLFPTKNSKGVILHLHGNAGAIHDWGKRAKLYTDNNYDILFLDYRGYGKSDSAYTNNDQLLGDVQKVYDYLKTRYTEDQIVVLGYSIGSGLAAYVAAHNNPSLLIMNAPYYSWKSLVVDQIAPIVPRFLVNYSIPTYEFLKDVKCPVKIFHGTRDNLIKPELNSVKLKALYPDKIELNYIDEASHNTIHISKQYYDALQRIL